MLSENTVIDSVMNKIFEVILNIVQFILNVIFSNNFVTLFFWFLLMNIIAIFIMKKDKQFAKNDKRRIRESTLIMVALAGGAVGMYYAMYKYKHKTLHKKFTILVPVFIVLHFALVSYMIVSSFVG
ncbi:MAG: DUF1294 domain-containing protein [Clostridia bacterium]|nr:DUF1294 domain-containing protein [Clostridia bacterium]